MLPLPILPISKLAGPTGKVIILSDNLPIICSSGLDAISRIYAAKFNGNNDQTFTNFDPKQWGDTVRQLDQTLTDIEKLVTSASDEQFDKWASTVGAISAHNAYHIGEIVMVRKEQGVWDPNKGVK